MKNLIWGIVVCLAVGAELCVCHPNGAGSCDRPKGKHGEKTEGDGGYELKLQHNGPVLPGREVNLVLSHTNGTKFKGFHIIAEKGEFVDLPEGVKNTTDCLLSGRITHTNKEEKDEVLVTYRVPRRPGPVNVTCYVVEELKKWFGPITLEIHVVLLGGTPAPGDGSEPEAKPQPEPVSESKPEAETETEIEPQTKTETDTQTETETETPTETKAKTETETETDVKIEAQTETQTEEQSETDEKPETDGEEKAEEEPPPAASSKECQKSYLEGYECMQQFRKFYTLHWTVGSAESQGRRRRLSQFNDRNPGEGEILFAMEGVTEGWVSLGFAEKPAAMAPADAVIGWIDNDGGRLVVKAYRITEEDVEESDADSSIDIRVVGGIEENGKTIIEFIKTVDAGYVPVSLDKTMYINYAIGNEDRLVKHPASGRGSTRLNLKSGKARRLNSPLEVTYFAHGSLMVIAWFGFIPLGILVARHKWSPKNLGESGWLDVHRVFVMFASLSFLTALIIAIARFEEVRSPVGRAHVGFALFVIISLSVQIMLGILRPLPSAPKRELFRKAHSWLGRILASLAVLTVFLGISALKRKLQVDVVGWVVAVVLLSIVHICVGFTAELYLVKKRRTSASGEIGMTGIDARVPYTRGLETDEGPQN